MIEIIGTELYQWDTGRSVRITGIEVDKVHFANKGDSKAVIMDIVDSQAMIPDYLLQTGKQLCVYAVANGVTIESKTFSVKNRERPEDYVYEDDQRNYIYELIRSAEDAVEAANLASTEATAAANQARDAANYAAQQVAETAAQAEEMVNTAVSQAEGRVDTALLQAKQSVDSFISNAGDAAAVATKAAGAADIAAEAADQAATRAAQTAKSLMVVGKVSGTSIDLDDAIDQFLVGGRIFGKTTQAGTPTPDVPVDLVSTLDGGSLSIHVNSKNLFTGWIDGGINPDNGVDIAGGIRRRTDYLPIFIQGQAITISGIPSTLYNMAAFYDANKVYISRSAGNGSAYRTYSVPAGAKYFRISVYESASTTGSIAEVDAMANQTMIEAGSTVTGYEKGKPVQAATILSLNGLLGIPVASGGNYTDASGQQWVCDEIDFGRGVRVQRCCKETVVPTYHTSNDRYHATLMHKANLSYAFDSGIFVMCDKLPFNGKATSGMNGIRVSTAETNLAIAYYNGQNPGVLTLVYPLATPIETPLSEEELAAYASLHTYRGNTTISNDGFAHMDIEYVMDAKKYIDSLMTGAILPATVE